MDGLAYERSTAALRVLQALGRPWSLCAVLLYVPLYVPRVLRDWIYDQIARRRRSVPIRTCRITSAHERTRFLAE